MLTKLTISLRILVLRTCLGYEKYFIFFKVFIFGNIDPLCLFPIALRIDKDTLSSPVFRNISLFALFCSDFHSKSNFFVIFHFFFFIPLINGKYYAKRFPKIFSSHSGHIQLKRMGQNVVHDFASF